MACLPAIAARMKFTSQADLLLYERAFVYSVSVVTMALAMKNFIPARVLVADSIVRLQSLEDC